MSFEILCELQTISNYAPQLRLGQIIHNATGGADLFSITDEYLLSLVIEYRMRIENEKL